MRIGAGSSGQKAQGKSKMGAFRTNNTATRVNQHGRVEFQTRKENEIFKKKRVQGKQHGRPC